MSPLTDALRAIAAPGVRVGSLAVSSAHVASLAPAERELVATAGPVRLAEFATGRALLHELLQVPQPLLARPSGAVDFRAGTVGSLAHDHRFAIAATGSGGTFAAIGIDVEPQATADDELREGVLRVDDPPLDPTAAFVMKEAAYKAWSGLGGSMIGPLDVALRVQGNTFVAAMPDGASIAGRHTSAMGYWLALATVGITH